MTMAMAKEIAGAKHRDPGSGSGRAYIWRVGLTRTGHSRTVRAQVFAGGSREVLSLFDTI